MTNYHPTLSTVQISTLRDVIAYHTFEQSLIQKGFRIREHDVEELGKRIKVSYFSSHGTQVYLSDEQGKVFVVCHSNGWNNQELTPDDITREGSMAISLAYRFLPVEKAVDLLNRPVRRELFNAHPDLDLSALVLQPA